MLSALSVAVLSACTLHVQGFVGPQAGAALVSPHLGQRVQSTLPSAAAAPPLEGSSNRRSIGIRRRRRTSSGGESSSSLSAQIEAAGGKQEQERICVVGGGFGGLYTALRLSQLPWTRKGLGKPRITLIDKKDKFVFLPLLYELAVGNAEIAEVAPPFKRLLQGTGIEFAQGSVSGVDLDSKQVEVKGLSSDGLDGCVISEDADTVTSVPYDKLVIAVGSEPTISMIEGAEKHAYTFVSVQDCYKLRQAVRSLEARADLSTIRVVVVGASYSGVELACNLNAKLGRDRAQVTLVQRSGEAVSTATSSNREAALSKLAASGIELMLNTDVVDITEGEVEVQASGAESSIKLGADLIVWTAGARPASLLQSLDLPQTEAHQLQVNPFLSVLGKENEVYCLGDIASLQGQGEEYEGLVPTAQVAIQQADCVAWNVFSSSLGRPLIKFKYTNLGELLTLGPRDGSLSTLGNRINLSGPAAGLARRLIYTVRMPTNGQRARAAAGVLQDTVVGSLTFGANVAAGGLSVLDSLASRSKSKATAKAEQRKEGRED